MGIIYNSMETLFQISLFLFLTWREYFYSQQTKDLNKVPLLLRNLAYTTDYVSRTVFLSLNSGCLNLVSDCNIIIESKIFRTKSYECLQLIALNLILYLVISVGMHALMSQKHLPPL